MSKRDVLAGQVPQLAEALLGVEPVERGAAGVGPDERDERGHRPGVTLAQTCATHCAIYLPDATVADDLPGAAVEADHHAEEWALGEAALHLAAEERSDAGRSVGSALRARLLGLAAARALEVDAVSVVHDAVEDRVCDGRVRG